MGPAIRVGWAVAVVVTSFAAAAQERPTEADLFGAAPAAAAAPAPASATGTAAAPARETEMFGVPEAERQPSGTAARLEEKAGSEPLKIGGQFYLRAGLSARRDQPASQWTLSSPNLLDAYLDARPNDRVRAFVLGRVAFDPTVDSGSTSALGAAQTGGPKVSLDQLWVAFDIERTVFVTAGRQHVKWGTGRFWSPTDFLHPVRKDPLALFDSRTGTTMLRVHVPWEKRGWNFTAVALLEGSAPAGTQTDAQTGAGAAAPSGAYSSADLLGKVAGAARAEVVLGAAEFGLDVIARRGKFVNGAWQGGEVKGGVDFSAAIWELDVYGDLALKTGTDVPLYELVPGGSWTNYLSDYRAKSPSGFTPAATLGASWSWKYSDEDTLTLGAEYFFNANGYDDARIYPYLLGRALVAGEAAFNPFYLGQHYAGLFAFVPRPGSWNNTSITLSALGNLSDRSFLARLDWGVTVLTYLSLELYGAVHFGSGDGEFRLGIDVPSFPYVDAAGQLQHSPEVHLPPPLFDVGVNLRVKL